MTDALNNFVHPATCLQINSGSSGFIEAVGQQDAYVFKATIIKVLN